MNVKKIMIASSLLMTVSCSASDPVSLMNAATLSLQTAQNSLTQLLALGNSSLNGQGSGGTVITGSAGSTEGSGSTVTTGSSGGSGSTITTGSSPAPYAKSGSFVDIQKAFAFIFAKMQNQISQAVPVVINNGPVSVFVMMFDGSNNQINPSPIEITAGGFSYLPANLAKLQVLDQYNNQLIKSSSVSATSCYAIANVKKKWSMAALSAPAQPTSLSYTNSTDLPVILTINTNNAIYNQELAPSQVFTQSIDPNGGQVAINAHANLAAIYCAYQPAALYKISITNNELVAEQTSATGNAIVNNCDWPVLVSLTGAKDNPEFMVLAQGQRFQPNTKTATGIMIIPSIVDFNDPKADLKSLSIVNQHGQLVLQ